MKKIKFFLGFTLFLIFCIIPNVNASEIETFNSKTVLGRFVNNQWEQVQSISSQTDTINLSQLDYDEELYPIWLGFYGNKTGLFEPDKIYNLSFRVDYSNNNNRFFKWREAMQYSQMQVNVTSANTNYCTMNVNNNSYSEFTCEFTVSEAVTSYYEIYISWWKSNLSNLGFSGIYSEMGMSLTFGLTLTSNTDYGGQMVSQNEIIIGQNQQIIDSNNAIKDEIISSTQQQIESEKVCYFIDKNKIVNDNKLLSQDGIETSNTAFGITNYIPINQTSKIKVVYNHSWNSYLCFYNINKERINCINNNTLIENSYLTIPNGASFVRFTIVKQQNKPQFEICANGNQSLNDSLNDLNQNITSEKLPDLDGLSNSAGWLPAGAVDSILNLPLSLFNSLTTVLSATCQPVNLTFPFINYNYQLPCVDDIYSKIGHLNSLLNTIGFIVSALILYKYFLSLYKWVDDTLTFRENNHIDNWGGV